MRKLTEAEFNQINDASPDGVQFGWEDDAGDFVLDVEEVDYWMPIYWPTYKADIKALLELPGSYEVWFEALPNLDLRLVDYARKPFEHPAEVNWTSPEQVNQKLFASVHYDLKGNKEQIDWMSPLGVSPVDPYGEQFTGEVVIRETRYTPQGVFGPSGCVRTFTAIRKDGGDGETWQVTDVYAGLASSKKGRKRRNDVLDRMTLWMGAAATAIGAPNPAESVSGWANTYAAEVNAFRDGKGSLLSEVVGLTTEPFFQVPVAPLGILLAAPQLADGEDPATFTLQQAIVKVLANWPL